MRAGRHARGRPPYGYRSSAGNLQTRLDQVDVVRRIFKLAAAGKSTRQIAATLTADLIASPAGRPVWNNESIALIVRNRVYLGERYGVVRAHPRIVTERTWQLANDQQRAR